MDNKQKIIFWLESVIGKKVFIKEDNLFKTVNCVYFTFYYSDCGLKRAIEVCDDITAGGVGVSLIFWEWEYKNFVDYFFKKYGGMVLLFYDNDSPKCKNIPRDMLELEVDLTII